MVCTISTSDLALLETLPGTENNRPRIADRTFSPRLPQQIGLNLCSEVDQRMHRSILDGPFLNVLGPGSLGAVAGLAQDRINRRIAVHLVALVPEDILRL